MFLGMDSCMLHAADLYGVPGGGRFRTPCNTFSDPDTTYEEHLPQARATPHDPHASARTKHTSRHALPPPDSATSPGPSRHSATPERRPDDDHAFYPRASRPMGRARSGRSTMQEQQQEFHGRSAPQQHLTSTSHP